MSTAPRKPVLRTWIVAFLLLGALSCNEVSRSPAGPAADTAAIMAWYNNGMAAIDTGNAEAARAAILQGLAESRNKSRLYEGFGLADLTAFYTYTGKYDSAEQAGKQALRIFSSENYKGHFYLQTRLSLMERFELNADHLQLTNNGLQILREAKAAADTPSIARALVLMSRAATVMADEDKFIGYQEEAVILLRKASDKRTLPKTLNNLGQAYSDVGRYEDALAVCKEALQHTTPDIRVDGYTYCYMAFAYIGLGQQDSALFYLSKSKEIADRFHDPRMALNSYSAYAEIYRHSGDYPAALRVLDSGIALMRRTGINAVMPAFLIARARNFSKMGNYKEALYAYQDSDSLLGALKEEEVQQKIAELDTKYKTREKEASIQLLSRTARVQRNWLMIVIALLVAATGLAVLVLVQFRRQKAANAIITSQAERLQWLMKEIHHRVKNNLQVITSLINMQLRKKEAAPAAERLLRDTVTRIQSIAIIHQKLYQNKEQETVVLRDYIQSLSQAIISVHGHAAISVETAMHLDADTAVLLGLVLTELITNSCKYARQEEQELRISVRISTTAAGHTMTYCDNGPGMPAEQKNDTMGMQIISLMTRQMGGAMTCVNNNGLCCTVTFKDEAQRRLIA